MNRIEKLRKEMKKSGLAALLLTQPMSIAYLTGVKVAPGERFFALYVDEKEAALFVNVLFSVTECEGAEIMSYKDGDDPLKAVSERFPKDSLCGVDGLMPAKLLLRLMALRSDLKFTDGGALTALVRMYKDKDEQAKMRASSLQNDEVMGELIELAKGRLSEKALAESLLPMYLKRGGSALSFDPITGYGPHAAEPHHVPDDTMPKEGDCLVLDIGGVLDGYCSDMTRTIFLGEPSPEMRKIYEIVKGAQQAALDFIKPGVLLKDIDTVARDYIEKAGYGEYFTHRLGHGIGLEVHEEPSIGLPNGLYAEPGMCFSVEPGIYVPGLGGVRIEDLVMITDEGVELLNHFSKDLIII